MFKYLIYLFPDGQTMDKKEKAIEALTRESARELIVKFLEENVEDDKCNKLIIQAYSNWRELSMHTAERYTKIEFEGSVRDFYTQYRKQLTEFYFAITVDKELHDEINISAYTIDEAYEEFAKIGDRYLELAPNDKCEIHVLILNETFEEDVRRGYRGPSHMLFAGELDEFFEYIGYYMGNKK
jgi:hypothetical protein